MMMHSDTPADTEEGLRGEGGCEQQQQQLKRRLFTFPTLTAHRVLLAKVGGVKQVVGRLLKGGQHQDALLHLGQSEPGDAQNFTLDVQAATNQNNQKMQ